MDRSFLSDANVVEASRNFVCLRLATYEDSAEAKFLTKIYGRTLSNTVFTVLTPDATQTLLRPDRGPRFRRASQLADWMNTLVTSDYAGADRQLWKDQRVPAIKSVDLALNVASCDRLPLIMTVGRDAAAVEESQAKLLPLAWSDDFAGQFLFANATLEDDLRAVAGLDEGNLPGFYVVQPDDYGLSGKVLHRFANVEQATDKLRSIVDSYRVAAKNHGQHVRMGVQMGFRWQTETPVTDQQFVRATERLWGEKYEHKPKKKEE